MKNPGSGDDEDGIRESRGQGSGGEPYRQLVENAHEGIAIIQNERFVFCNDRFAELLGTTPAGLDGQRYLSFIEEVASMVDETVERVHDVADGISEVAAANEQQRSKVGEISKTVERLTENAE